MCKYLAITVCGNYDKRLPSARFTGRHNDGQGHDDRRNIDEGIPLGRFASSNNYDSALGGTESNRVEKRKARCVFIYSTKPRYKGEGGVSV